MDSRKKYHHQKLLEDVDSILDEINSTVEEDEKLIKSLESEPQKSSSFITDEEILLSFIPSDGHIDLKVSKDKLKVTATLYPPTEGGTPVSLQMLSNEMNKAGIKGRYNREELIDTILTCNIENKIFYDVEILEGLAPVNSYSQEFI
ncbi:MAG: hypothetical protein JEY91_09100 [Spirochaetaceae bacterium]|nr:hypothetical protein [Spirochaetaceae bacterium]